MALNIPQHQQPQAKSTTVMPKSSRVLKQQLLKGGLSQWESASHWSDNEVKCGY